LEAGNDKRPAKKLSTILCGASIQAFPNGIWEREIFKSLILLNLLIFRVQVFSRAQKGQPQGIAPTKWYIKKDFFSPLISDSLMIAVLIKN
jgi:hypothetical protein